MAERNATPADDIETIMVDKREVACDGGEGALGHPRVYLNMGDEDRIDCPYCGRRFVLSPKGPPPPATEPPLP